MSVAFVSLWGVSESLHRDLHTTLDELAQAFPLRLCSFVSFCISVWPYLLPPLFAILLEAPLSLRAWIAVQKTPCPERARPSPCTSRLRTLRKHAFAHLAPIYFLFISLLVSYLQCVASISQDWVRTIETVTLGPLFWFASCRLLGILSRMYKLSIKRDADGDPRIIRTLRPSNPRVLQVVPIGLAFIVTYRAILLDDSICKAIVHVALIHVFVSVDARSRESIRAAGVYALTNIATLLALTIFLAIQAKRIGTFLNDSSSDSNDISSSRLDSENYENLIEDPNGYRWPLLALAVLWNIFPLELISLCYRFDYMRFVRLQGLSLSSVSSPEGTTTVHRHGPSLTYDMLPETTKVREGEEKGPIGPIFLALETPDSLYSRLPPPPPYTHLRTDSGALNKPTEDHDVGTPLPSSLYLLTQTHQHIHIPFPAFLTSLTTYLSSTLFLSLCIYLTAQEHKYKQDALNALKCLVPLLPLVTLPLSAFAVPLGLAFFAEDGNAAIKDLWRYEENWRMNKGVRRGGQDGVGQMTYDATFDDNE